MTKGMATLPWKLVAGPMALAQQPLLMKLPAGSDNRKPPRQDWEPCNDRVAEVPAIDFKYPAAIHHGELPGAE
jgi:hypothetical protein